MAKSRTESAVKKIEERDLSYLQAYAEGDDSLQTLQQYRVLPRLQIIQGLSNQALKDAHGEGAVILIPGGTRVAKRDDVFFFVPIFHYTEFVKWADKEDRDSPAVLERSYDPSSDVATRARDANRREEAYSAGSKMKYRYVEHIVFPGMLYGPTEGAGTLCAMTFQKGEFFQGMSFASACMNRRISSQQRAPLWAQVWKFKTALREKGMRKWYGLDFATPDEQDGDVPLFITIDEVESFKALHAELKADHAAQVLQVDHSVEDADERINVGDVDLEEAGKEM